MDPAQAREVLGVDIGASPEEVDDAFKQKAKETHPDATGDDNAAGFLLAAQAREVLLKEQSTVLVPLDQAMELIKLATGDLAARNAQDELRKQTSSVVSSVIKFRTSRQRRLRNQLGMFGLATTFLTAGSQLLRLMPKSALSSTVDVPNILTFGFGAISILFGLVTAVATYRIATIQTAIEEIQENLDDRMLVSDTIRHVLDAAGKQPPLSRDEWHTAVEDWFRADRYGDGPARYFARRIGTTDFARIIYAKAREQHVIAETDSRNNGRLVVTFDFA